MFFIVTLIPYSISQLYTYFLNPDQCPRNISLTKNIIEQKENPERKSQESSIPRALDSLTSNTNTNSDTKEVQSKVTEKSLSLNNESSVLWWYQKRDSEEFSITDPEQALYLLNWYHI